MYVINNIFAKHCKWIDASDIDVILRSIVEAKRIMPLISDCDVAKIKKATPAVCISTLSKRDAESDATIDRTTVFSSRGRRKFMMIDADFDAGEEEQSAAMREKLIDLADRLKTQLIIYPTASYPAKPRFRAVMFTRRLMNEAQYYQAMSWWYKSLDVAATDDLDFKLGCNRNLPVFINQDQADAVFIANDDALTALDNSLWRDMPKPDKHAHARNVTISAIEHAVTFNTGKLITASFDMSKTKIAQSYITFWRVVASIAAAIVAGGISEDTAFDMLDNLAEAGNDQATIQRWRIDNKKLLKKQMAEIRSNSQDKLTHIRPLASYTEFATALTSNERKSAS